MLVERIRQHFIESINVKQSCYASLAPLIATAANQMISALMNDAKILSCGNGGSAADAQHFAAEMLGRFEKERPGLAALALNTDTAALTAIANDYDYDLIFSKQIRALGHRGDILLAISTSGNSANIVEAVRAAHERHMTVIALTGHNGGKLSESLSNNDILLAVPCTRTARIQETHILIIHSLCDAIDFILLDGE